MLQINNPDPVSDVGGDASRKRRRRTNKEAKDPVSAPSPVPIPNPVQLKLVLRDASVGSKRQANLEVLVWRRIVSKES